MIPRPFRPLSHRLPPRRRRPHGALQLALCARHGGTFVLRIEDTDAERSSSDMVDGILDGLRWLGLDWDEGPASAVRMRRRIFSPTFFTVTGRWPPRLVASGARTTATARPRTEGEARSRGGARAGLRPRMLRADAGEIAAREQAGTPRAVRIPRAPKARCGFDDLVHGPIEFDGAHIEDFVILRSDGQPTLSPVRGLDDVEMAITHVVRGDDHISNTPKQILCCIRRSARRSRGSRTCR